MKFIVSSLKLLKSLQALSGVIGSKNTLPILDDFLFHLEENQLRITSSDLDVTMTVALVPDMVDGTGDVTIPARLLLEISQNADLGKPKIDTLYAKHIIATLFNEDGTRNEKGIDALKTYEVVRMNHSFQLEDEGPTRSRTVYSLLRKQNIDPLAKLNTILGFCEGDKELESIVLDLDGAARFRQGPRHPLALRGHRLEMEEPHLRRRHRLHGRLFCIGRESHQGVSPEGRSSSTAACPARPPSCKAGAGQGDNSAAPDNMPIGTR